MFCNFYLKNIYICLYLTRYNETTITLSNVFLQCSLQWLNYNKTFIVAAKIYTKYVRKKRYVE